MLPSHGRGIWPRDVLKKVSRGLSRVEAGNPGFPRLVQVTSGCLLLRPNKVMGMDDPENPTIIEDLIRALGAEAVVYARRNECCGGYISVESPESARRNASAIIENAKAAGAEMIITACPLCKYNLEKCGADIPVVYFTELLAEALGVKEDTNA